MNQQQQQQRQQQQWIMQFPRSGTKTINYFWPITVKDCVK